MTATVAMFRTRFPEFGDDSGSFPDARVTLALGDALLQMNSAAWGLRADLGQLYLAAHLLAIEGDAFGGTAGTALGALTSESVGDTQHAFGHPDAGMMESERDLLWTKYGIVFSRMKRTLVSTPLIL